MNARYDFVDLDYTTQVKRLKKEMYVVFNWAREKFIVKDIDAQGMHYIYMIVQEPDGAFRDFDERTLATIREDMWGGPNVGAIVRKLEKIEEARLAEHARTDEELQYGFTHDFKWAGIDVTPSVIWRERGLSKEDLAAMKGRSDAGA